MQADDSSGRGRNGSSSQPLPDELTPLPPAQRQTPWAGVKEWSQRTSAAKILGGGVVGLLVALVLVGWSVRGSVEGLVTKPNADLVTERVRVLEVESAVNVSQHAAILRALERMESKIDRIAAPAPSAQKE
jgi:hypothetical protein